MRNHENNSQAGRDWDSARCEAWIQRILHGDSALRHELVAHLWPFWLSRIATNRSMGRFRSSDDHVRNVATNLATKLTEPQSDALAQFAAWRRVNPNKDFGDWMRIVIANAVRDYVRGQLGSRRSTSDEPSPKLLLNEFATTPINEDVGIRPPFTDARTAQELLEFARARLTPERVQVLEHWLMGESLEGIAQAVKLDVEAARKQLRATLAVLRRHFLVAPELQRTL